METQRKEITKSGFRTIVWAIIIVGLLFNGITSTIFISSGVTESQMRMGFYMAVSLLVTGFGIGLSQSRLWKIKDFD